MAVSVLDLFKIGIGPSSSHTVGPMKAARMFAEQLAREHLMDQLVRVQVTLYGSLGATGKGHGSDMAVVLGLMGQEPDKVDPDAIPGLLDAVRRDRQLVLNGIHPIAFDADTDIVMNWRETLPVHANGMRIEAFGADHGVVCARTYYSVGGGFVVTEELAGDASRQKAVAPGNEVLPWPFNSGEDLLRLAEQHQCSIADVMRHNERYWRPDEETVAKLMQIWQTMQACVERGCRTEGMLPGRFEVKRRAPLLLKSLPEKMRYAKTPCC